MTKLKRAWIWIKNFWYLPVVVAAFIVMLIVLRKKPEGLGNILMNAVDSHKKEVNVLNQTHAEEIAKRERALNIYHSTVGQIEERFLTNQETLDSKKKKEIKRIIAESQDSPEDLVRRISNISGFKVIMPEEENAD